MIIGQVRPLQHNQLKQSIFRVLLYVTEKLAERIRKHNRPGSLLVIIISVLVP